jgi:NAD+ diphosphatase
LRDNRIRTPSGISIAQRIIEHWLGARVADVVGPSARSWG